MARIFERRAFANNPRETFVLDESAWTPTQNVTMVAYLLECGYTERDDALVSTGDRHAADVHSSPSMAVVEDQVVAIGEET
jgi:hypothetical protein